MKVSLKSPAAGYGAAVLGVAAATAALKLPGEAVNETTVALTMLLVVLFIATLWGSRPAIAASLAGVLCFNFFFLPPTGTLTIEHPHNWVALVAFLITAITAGHLSASARRRAEEAEAGRREIERLYTELREAFERASHAEALRQSERLKSALLDAVTHDLRTPLTSIKASATALLDEGVAPDDEARRDMLEVIDEECDRLNHFIEGLVELARIEAGELQLRRRWGNIEEIISGALARAKKITLDHRVEVETERELPAVRMDSRAVSEVLYALVDNAAKYSPAGTTIRITAARDRDESVRMSVEDQGRGVEAGLRERVFDKFFRATRAAGPRGIGMGLAIARGIIEAHGGKIWIEDGPAGRGARVIFTLPVGDDEPAQEEVKDEPEAAHSRG
ncbi:MAG TPA: DUF4118 domain-containing protein [Blastocatellia bacterium]|jgi:two-component system sensor histidine kinase KdpD